MSKQAHITDTDDYTATTDAAETNTTDTSEDDPQTRSDSEQGGAQVGLTDVSYEEHAAATPPENRVTEELHYESFLESSVGDVLWIDGTEYVVVDHAMSILGPRPLIVVGEDGSQGKMVAGKLPNDRGDGVAWTSDLKDKEQHELSRSDLICGYDRVYRLEEESLEYVHRWTPDTDNRDCPACDEDRTGEPVRIERQASEAVEIRHCSNTDCKYVFRYVREFPDATTANIVTNDFEDSLGITDVTGVFEAEEQDDFKFPIETNDGREDGFYTASEIAAFVNPKMTSPALAELVASDEETSVADLLQAVEFTTEETSISGRTTEKSLSEFNDLYEQYASDTTIPFDEDLQEQLQSASAEAFMKALMILRAVSPKQSWESFDSCVTGSPGGFGLDPLVVANLAEDWVNGDLSLSTDPRPQIRDAHGDSYNDTVDELSASQAVTVVLSGADTMSAGPTSLPELTDDTVDNVVTILTELLATDGSISSDMDELLVELVTDVFESDLSGDDALTSVVFKELLEEYTDSGIFGGVSVDRNRSGNLVVEWRDDEGFQKKMRVTFTRIEANQIDAQTFGWYAERHDISEIAP